MTATPLPDSGALRRAFEALPISAFDRPDADDPAALLPGLFGPETTVKPVVHCAHLGTWVGGWTVVTTLPEGQGSWAFVIREHQGDYPEWDRMSRGTRINVLSRAVTGVHWCAQDRLGLAVEMVRAMSLMEAEAFDFDTFGAFNEVFEPWVLRQTLGLLSAEESEALRFLLALNFTQDTLDWVGSLVTRVEHIAANWERTEESETAIVEAVRRYNGVTIRGAQVERLGVAGALMTHPVETWQTEADRLVARAYERMPLPQDFHPRTPPPEPPTTSGGGPGSWAIAV